MISLVIDASTYRGTVAAFRERTVVASSAATMRGAHSEALMPAVADVLERAGLAVGDLDRVICGDGPGSFTSLRIAASIAKGICLGRGIPLFRVSSLGLVASASGLSAGAHVAIIDALRDEWYAAVFDRDGAGVVMQRAPFVLVAKPDIDVFAAGIGPVISSEPNAADCAALFGEIERSGPVDLDRWEPSYGRLAEAQVKWEAAHGRPLKA